MKTSEHDSRSDSTVQGLADFGAKVLDEAAKLDTPDAKADAAARHLQQLIRGGAPCATVEQARTYARDTGLISHTLSLKVVKDELAAVGNGNRRNGHANGLTKVWGSSSCAFGTAKDGRTGVFNTGTGARNYPATRR